MRRFLATFFDAEGQDLVHLVFSVAEPEQAFALAKRVMESAVLDDLGVVGGFEVEGLPPRAINSGDMARFIANIDADLRTADAEGGGQ